MARRMTPRDRRALVIAAWVLIPSLFFVEGVKPYVAALTDARAQLVSERSALARERAAVAAALRHPRLREDADSLMRATTARLFSGRDEVMASADLATYVGDVAKRSHVWLQDAATRPPTKPDGGIRALNVDIRAESDLRGVLAFLQGLERGGKLIRVARIDISRAGGDADVEDAEVLSFSATISGYETATETPPGARPTRSVAVATGTSQASTEASR